jgi:peroxiredoxin
MFLISFTNEIKYMALTFSNMKGLLKGNKTPFFELKGTDNQIHSLNEFEGNPLLIIFMCNHCPYVVPKFSYINELQKKYPALKIIGINSNDQKGYPEDSFEKMKEYAQKNKFNFFYLADETQETAKKFGATCTPDPFLFNEKHELVYHGRIDDAHGKPHEEAQTKELEEAIIQTIEKKTVPVNEMPSCGCNIKWKHP